MNRPNPMNLSRISDFDLEYRKSFEDADILNFEVRTRQGDRAGKVSDILIDNIGQLYYLVIDIGSWLNRKLVLVTPHQFSIDRQQQAVYLPALDKNQISELPPYSSAVQESSQSQASSFQIEQPQFVRPVEASMPLEASAALDSPEIHFEQVPRLQVSTPQVAAPSAQPRDMQVEPTVSTGAPSIQPMQISPNLDDQTTVRLLEERLVIDRRRQKIGEVIVRKEIETRIVEVPVRREKLIIEQISPEHKQLAIVDLPSEELSDLQLSQMAHSALQPVAEHDFVEPEVAHRILAEMSQRLNQSGSRVRLVFEDSQMQAEYQQHLHR